MSPSSKTSGSHPRATPASLFSPSPLNNQAILLEKLNARKSTPDSEALASSDDDLDHRQEMASHSTTIPRSGRRASWLNDTSQAPLLPVRTASFAGSMSPTTSHPSTPSAETGTSWAPHANSNTVIGRASASTASPLIWGTGIWNTDRKEPPSRLTEVLPSPTSTEVPPNSGGSSYLGADSGRGQSSPAAREPVTNPQIPFAIPLEPTPKTYRSQSYSVGQLDPETLGGMVMTSSIGRTRSIMPHSALHHRPSRPSMLSEMNDGSGLGKVNEDDGDDEDDSGDGYPRRNGDTSVRAAQQQQSADAKTIEMLTRENAMLRQQQHWQNSRLRPRTSTSSAYGPGASYSLHEPVPEESDYAIDELDENGAGDDLSSDKRAIQRRMSEFAAASGPIRTSFAGQENRKLENIRKAHWQSSLGFSGLDGLAQSRRHSFADVPTRHASICSVGDGAFSHERAAAAATAAVQEGRPAHDLTLAPAETGALVHQPSVISPQAMDSLAGPRPLPYFNGAVTPVSPAGPYSHHHACVPLPYTLPARFSNNRPVSPHRSLYNLGMAQPRQNQPLYVVLFKCARADVFYIQEGTGLSVKPGDLVIVEADRGTDLGTVAVGNVEWHQAKEYKDHYAEEQYKWLMMYSHNATAAQDGAGTSTTTMSNALPGSAVGGMGPPSQHHMPEPSSGELKPKLIKRLAQNHEIQGLREKEGQEAKAKRVCMQKVKEHGLSMEILDAEFQMDWKKLTFYYFADSYINFNSLVTDLFKIYKTRIWMSAINPASFASPALGLQAPSGIGPGAVNTTREGVGANSDRRHNVTHVSQLAHPPPPPASSTVSTISASPPPPRTFVNSSVMHSFGNGQHPVSLAPSYAVPAYPYESYGPGANAGSGRPGGLPPYASPMTGSGEGFALPFTTVDYRSSRSPFSPGTSRAPSQPRGTSPLAPPNEWIGPFQGLSLNSR